METKSRIYDVETHIIEVAKQCITYMPNNTLYWFNHALTLTGIKRTVIQVQAYLTLAQIELEKEKRVKYVLDGIVIEGDARSMEAFLKKHNIELQGYYRSETHGYVLIASMQTLHIRNAILKAMRNMLDSAAKDTSVPLVALFDLSSYPREIQDLVTEYKRR